MSTPNHIIYTLIAAAPVLFGSRKWYPLVFTILISGILHTTINFVL